MPLTGSLKTLLLRGLLAGLIAGLLAATVGFFIGEPHIDAAIAIEEAGSGGHSHGTVEEHSHEEEPLVSRSGQQAGQFLALALAGMAFGAILAAVLNVGRRFTTLPGPRLCLAAAGFGWVAIVAVPFFKYPANPPAVGDPATIDQRTWLWVAVVVLGLLAVAAAIAAYRALAGQLSSFRLIAAVAAFALVTAVGYVLLPGVNEVSDDFPATLLWQFRVASLAETATLWAALGLAFAALTEWSTARSTPVAREVATSG
ncbi:CbtA family protein [Nocardia caishijiensis]|uniref:Cobalt transporter CbtA n=1 Tax=Nocardia caishijiensis TaxID=184756 RepID=A0ABQ6YFI1_9NOCA|nr:CbtA family protein [Nocardia caishijiensis]KAF0836516.1 putative cobalt transporter CbtA [Nocardia caishijiensis]